MSGHANQGGTAGACRQLSSLSGARAFRFSQAEKGHAVGTERLVLHFDGGSRGNPGPGYGSYVLLQDGAQVRHRHLEFGPRMTNNEAEYETLIAGVQEALDWLRSHGQDPAQASLEVRGDSQLVIRQLQGTWKAREPRMAALRDRTLALLSQFGCFSLRQVPRIQSVKLLGH